MYKILFNETLSLIGRLKDHKENTPLRPIVTKHSAPTYYIEKASVSYLKTILPPSDYVIDSAADFVKRIKNISINHNSILASLYIVSLYPFINSNEIVKVIETFIDNNPNFNHDIRTTLKSAISIITQNNVFVFNSKRFRF